MLGIGTGIYCFYINKAKRESLGLRNSMNRLNWTHNVNSTEEIVPEIKMIQGLGTDTKSVNIAVNARSPTPTSYSSSRNQPEREHAKNWSWVQTHTVVEHTKI